MLLWVLTALVALVAWKLFSAPKSAKKTGKAPSERGVVDGEAAMTIVYGSQSGTAEGYAFVLEAEAKAYGFATTVVDAAEFDADSLNDHSFVVLLMATHGEGEPTDSTIALYEHIKERTDDLEDVNFAVFGLGNTQYEFYNAVAKFFDTRFEELGAKRVCDVGLGDDDYCLEDDFADWRQKQLWPKASLQFLGRDAGDIDIAFVPNFEVEFVTEKSDPRYMNATKQVHPLPVDPKHRRAKRVPVVMRKELRPVADAEGEAGSTLHVEFDLKAARLRYKTADNLAIFACNDRRRAAKMCEHLEVHPQTVFTMSKRDPTSGHKFPTPRVCTAHAALTWYVDISGAMRKSVVRDLLTFAEDGADRAFLKRMIQNNDEGKALWKSEVEQPGLGILELLQKFKSVRVPFAAFVELMPRLQPRLYTISSSSRVQPHQVSVTAKLVRDVLPDGRVRNGVCSTFLSEIRPGKDEVMVLVEESTFRLPRKAATPVIMVGPGTGVAPFRAFVQETQKLDKSGDWWLAFGCRHEARDFIYRDELQGAADAKKIELVTAFSRDQKDKIYVQHRVKEHGERLFELIDKHNAHVYVCGATGMGRSVRDAFVHIIETQSGMTSGNAVEYVHKMQSDGRYVQELWDG